MMLMLMIMTTIMMVMTTMMNRNDEEIDDGNDGEDDDDGDDDHGYSRGVFLFLLLFVRHSLRWTCIRSVHIYRLLFVHGDDYSMAVSYHKQKTQHARTRPRTNWGTTRTSDYEALSEQSPYMYRYGEILPYVEPTHGV